MSKSKLFSKHIGGEIAKGLETPEHNRMAEPTPKLTCAPLVPVGPTSATEYITISVAEYHFLTRAATILEVMLSDSSYDHRAVWDAAFDTMADMKKLADGGGKE